METFLTCAILVIAFALFALIFLGAVSALGQLFASVANCLTPRGPTLEERDIARLLAETSPPRR